MYIKSLIDFSTPITTPVLLLVFNRPEKTKRVFDVIKSVKPTKLYVASDGQRYNYTNDIEKIKEVRTIVSNIDWECDFKFLFHDNNLGCSLSGKTAWDWLFSHEEEMIFLEDDGVVSKSFFWFSQELLDKYRNNNKIGFIGSANYDVTYGKNSYFFSRLGCGTYGMATWKRVYDLYEYKIESFKELKKKQSFRDSFSSIFEYKFRLKQFSRYFNKGGNTYDIQIAYLIYKCKMFWVVPNINMVTNIGFDDESSNYTGDTNRLIANIYGNRKCFEIEKIFHPKEVSIDKNFEKDYLFKRFFPTQTKLSVIINLYVPFLGKIWRKFFKTVRN